MRIGVNLRKLTKLCAVTTALAGLMTTVPVSPAAADVPDGYSQSTVFSGLDTPTAVEFAPDGTVFVIEKRGRVLRYDDVNDTTPSLVADRRAQTHNNSDRGMIGLAVDPDYPNSPWVYVSYALDQDPNGGPIPEYGSTNGSYDPCPNSGTTGCPSLSRVVRFDGTINNAPETVLFQGHCQQFPFHSVGDLTFDAQDNLLVSFGDGSTGSFVEWGQRDNLCEDPPGEAGDDLSTPTTEGGQARSQDILTRNDPTGVHGSVLRVDPDTFDAVAANPLSNDGEANVERMIATGMRNPFRIEHDPLTGRTYVANVGGAGHEEINVIEGPDLVNGGWPCYEGNDVTQNSFWLTTNICKGLIASGDHDLPLFTYGRNEAITPGESCPTGGLSISGLAVNRVGFGPSSLDGALFFTDYTRDCIWYLPADANGDPDASSPTLFATDVGALVDLEFGPDGALYAVDVVADEVIRIEEAGGNQRPTARFTVSQDNAAPLSVSLDGSNSTDPDLGDSLTYAWDFDGNGTTDATGAVVNHTYGQAGTYSAMLTVTDEGGLTDTTNRTVQVGTGDITLVVTEPADGRTFKVGAIVPLRASATYANGSSVDSSAFTWVLTIQHCIPNAPDACHVHDLATVTGNRSTFEMPDHEAPSFVQAVLTVDPPGAAAAVQTRPVIYRLVDLDVETVPAGLDVVVGSAGEAAPFTRELARDATTSVSVATTQTLNGSTYTFSEWRLDGVRLGTQPFTELNLSDDATLSAVFTAGNGPDNERPSTPRGLRTDDSESGIDLSWTASTDNVGVAGYNIYRSTNGTLGALYRTSSDTTFTDTAVTTGVTYTYAVRAFDAAGNVSSRTNLSDEVATGDNAPDTERPSTPRGLQTDSTEGGVHLSWVGSTDNVGVIGYNIYRSTNGSLGSLYQTSTGVGFTDTNVAAGMVYTYAVRAVDAAGNVSSRTNLSVELVTGDTPPDTERPSTPRGLRTDNVGNGISLNWTGSTDNVAVTGYNIYRSTNGSLGALYQTASGTSFTDTNVTDGVTYTYAVKAIDAAGNTSYRTNTSSRVAE